MELKYPIVIIGGGIGGLSAAIRLRIKGYQVVIFEKNDKVGGKMFDLISNGFRWDIGPTVITMRDVFEDLFRFAGKRIQDYIELIPIDPLTRYFFSNGKKLEIWRDLPQTLSSIAALNQKDMEGYLSYLSYAAQQFRITSPIYTYGPPPSWESFRNIRFRDLIQADVFRGYYSAIRRHVKSDEMRQFFARFATYVGGDPYKVTALLSVIAYVELAGGIWYPRGGIYKIAEAFERLAVEVGVSIVTNQTVKEILIQENTVAGILLDDGTSIKTQFVISNVDVATTYSNLISKVTSYTRLLNNNSYSPLSFSAFILLLGLKGQFPELGHHNIFFSSDYHREYKRFSQGIPADEPTIYVAISSKTDPQHAPPNCENWYVMVNVPSLDNSFDWEKNKRDYRDTVIKLLEQHGLNLTGKLIFERILTPLDLYLQSGAFQGALYGLSFNNWFAPFNRPKPQDKHIRGLYFVGGTTHPGGGVPMVMLSGKYVANLLGKAIERL